MTSPRRSLVRRTVVAAVSGSVVVAVVAVALSVPLLRGTAREQARHELARTVETLAATPRIGAQLLAREQRVVGPDDRRYAVVSRDGTISGDAADLLRPQDLSTLRAAGTLSTTSAVDGTTYLVEGRAVTKKTLASRGTSVVAVQPAPEQGPLVRSLLRRLGLALVVGILAGAALALALARRAAGPVRDAAERAHRLASGERGLAAPPPSAISEVDEMSDALTALDTALVASEGRQREFLLSISHELRTPLTALHGYAEALRDGAVAPEEVAAVGATLSSETQRLDRFIADLLALARLEADDFRVERSVVDLAALIDETVDAWSAQAGRAGARVLAGPSRGPSSGTFAGDPVRLRQVLDGLVENALRVSPDGGTVRVAGHVEGRQVVLEVTDDGPGLAPGDHARAFERGYLRDRYAAGRAVGTGLGLSIAHRLAVRMGAELSAHPADGGGTVMRLALTQDP